MVSKYTNTRYRAAAARAEVCEGRCPYDPPCDSRYPLRCEKPDAAVGVDTFRPVARDSWLHELHAPLWTNKDPLYEKERE